MKKPPSYRLHKGSGQAVIEVRGRRTYLGKHGSEASKRRYILALRQIAREQAVPIPAGGQATVATLVIAFLRWARDYYVHPATGKNTVEYEQLWDACQQMINATGDGGLSVAEIPLDDFGPTDLKCVRAAMVAAGWSRGYVNRQIGRLRRVFRWGVENELVPASVLATLRAVSPLAKGKTEAPETEPVKPVHKKHVTATRPFVSSRQVLAMIDLQQLTGMRAGEATIMRPCDIDRSGKTWLYTPGHHKMERTGRSRTIAIGPKAQKVLAPFLIGRADDAYCFSPAEADRERSDARRAARKTPLTPSQAARQRVRSPKRPMQSHYSVASYRRAIKYAIKQANKKRKPDEQIPNWSPLQLRHAAGTEVRKKFGLEASQSVLGHANAKVTEIYAERDLGLAVKVANRIG